MRQKDTILSTVYTGRTVSNSVDPDGISRLTLVPHLLVPNQSTCALPVYHIQTYQLKQGSMKETRMACVGRNRIIKGLFFDFCRAIFLD